MKKAHRSGVDLKQFMKLYMNFLLDAYKYFLMGDFEYLQIPSTYEGVKDILSKISRLLI